MYMSSASSNTSNDQNMSEIERLRKEIQAMRELMNTYVKFLAPMKSLIEKITLDDSDSEGDSDDEDDKHDKPVKQNKKNDKQSDKKKTKKPVESDSESESGSDSDDESESGSESGSDSEESDSEDESGSDSEESEESDENEQPETKKDKTKKAKDKSKDKAKPTGKKAQYNLYYSKREDKLFADDSDGGRDSWVLLKENIKIPPRIRGEIAFIVTPRQVAKLKEKGRFNYVDGPFAPTRAHKDLPKYKRQINNPNCQVLVALVIEH